MRRVIALAFAAAAAGCASPTEPVPARSPADVRLKVGQAAEVDRRLLVRFVGVPSDSRCPADVMCAWEGDAEVAILVTLDDGVETADTLHTMPAASSDTTAAYIVSLTDLTPYPTTSAPIAPGSYVAQLHVVAWGILTATEAARPKR